MRDDKPSAMESEYGTAILSGLQRKHVYAGTVGYYEKLQRRMRNRRARHSRKINRIS